MLIKFLDHGTGSATGAARYLLDKHDHNGIERVEVKVLRGDPVSVAQVADSLDFVNRYTSGVIAFAPEDNPSNEQIDAVLDDFERVAFAGLSRDRVAYSAILHREKDNACHIHIFVARVDLVTGKSLNIAPPGWEKSFDPIRDYYNSKYGWASPDDPARARTLSPGHVALIEASKLRAGLQVEPDPKSLVTRYIEQRIEAGKIKNRADVIEALREAGFQINREGKDYISIKDTDTGMKLRLKGAIYEQHFAVNRALEIADSARARSVRKPDARRAESARRELEAAIKRRAEYNEKRYQIRERATAEIDSKRQTAIRRAHVEIATHVIDSDAVAALADRDAVHIGRGRDVAIPADAHVSSADRQPEDERRQDLHGDHKSKLDYVRDQQKVVSVHTKSIEGEHNENRHDRDRTVVNRFIEEIERRIRNAREKLNRAIRRCRESIRHYDAELSSFAKTDAELVIASEELKWGHTKMIENRADELELFKTKISLTEYAESCGYTLDKKASSKHSHVMRGPGDDKIVIARDTDGHDIYFSVRDHNDNGSIIDFVQRRRGLNLGQVRKELRPWVGLSVTQSINRKKTEHERIERPQPVERNRAELIASFHRLKDYSGDYLERERKLKPDTIKAFLPVIRQDNDGRVCFLHYNQAGEVTGWERKDRGFTGFSAGGSKSLAMHMPDGDRVQRVVVVESMIDAMSYYERHGKTGDLYVSLSGSVSAEQAKQLHDVIKSAPVVVAATDNDEQGHKYADMIKKWRTDTVREIPRHGKDWNDEVQYESRRRMSAHMHYGMSM
jgi:hypothetical protein